MKTINKIVMFITVAVLISTVSCTKDSELDLQEDANLTTSFEKPGAKQMQEDVTAFMQSRVPINYEGALTCSAQPAIINGSFDNATYYTFNGNAGDVITLWVKRTVADVDPVSRIYIGSGADTDDLTFLASSDDAINDDLGGCFSDPFYNLTLPQTGDYTLQFWDFTGDFCGTGNSSASVEIITTGLTDLSNADCDACEDDVDPHPNSIIGGNVVIDGCDSSAPNMFVDDCSTMMDMLSDCADNASSHSEYLACVVGMATQWRIDGLINGRQNFYIQRCARNANIPDQEVD